MDLLYSNQDADLEELLHIHEEVLGAGLPLAVTNLRCVPPQRDGQHWRHTFEHGVHGRQDHADRASGQVSDRQRCRDFRLGKY